MNESILKSLLEESVNLEWAKYDNISAHNFSKKHNREMKQVFKLYDKNISETRPHKYLEYNRPVKMTAKRVLLLASVLFLAVLAGCSAAYYISKSFQGNVYSDRTQLYPIDIENCPTIIEEKYYLPELPEGFVLWDTDSNPYYEYVAFRNADTGQSITFSQDVKKKDWSTNFNTEYYQLEEIEINGHYGVCIDFSTSNYISSHVLWDNGDYILHISANLPMNEVIDLAKSAKVYEN